MILSPKAVEASGDKFAAHPVCAGPYKFTERVAQDLAQLLRCKRAVLAPSTLHLYWDLFDLLARDHIAIYVDAGTYPIARWGIERAAAKGVRTATFPTHDSAALECLLYRDRREGCDGC